jgi:hypothetical protein
METKSENSTILDILSMTAEMVLEVDEVSEITIQKASEALIENTLELSSIIT